MNFIVGQGIAGSVLALELLRRGEEVLVFDDGHRTSSSMVAAGLWNPVVFRRINLGWMSQPFSQTIASFYPWAESLLGAAFYHPMPMVRIHASELEKSLWIEKQTDPDFVPHLGADATTALPTHLAKALPYGASYLHGGGYLNVPAFLEATRSFLSSQGRLVQQRAVWYGVAHPEEVSHGGVVPTRIIDCTGSRSPFGKWFFWLPFGLTKGEVLTVRSEDLHMDYILNAGGWVLPIGNGQYRVGATFNWDQKDEVPTEAGMQELAQKWSKLFDLPLVVEDHRAGLRPTVQDRRPLLGKHPVWSRLFIFNGLGTKGVFLAPWLAHHFAEYLLGNEALHCEADIARFAHLFGAQTPMVNYPVR